MTEDAPMTEEEKRLDSLGFYECTIACESCGHPITWRKGYSEGDSRDVSEVECLSCGDSYWA